MKSVLRYTKHVVLLSPLAMAEWIEIEDRELFFKGNLVSASDGGVD